MTKESFLGFTQEEKDIIEAFNSLIISNSKSKQLILSMISFADDNITSQGLLFNEHNLRFLSEFTQSPEVKVLLGNIDNPKKCPKCNDLMESDCGKFHCYNCKLTFFVENHNTRGVCPGCMYHRDSKNLDINKLKSQGFGTGCPGVYDKGNEIEKYIKNNHE